MENDETKSFAQMNARELFLVLTGDKGIMAQTHLQKIIREYLARYTEMSDLESMVRIILEDRKKEAASSGEDGEN
ncbi:MAG: hypothetical protein IKD81_06885 [Eubacteriaceae bacterium]|nr:hypothetical protein [Eubacteriaceae bacterium]